MSSGRPTLATMLRALALVASLACLASSLAACTDVLGVEQLPVHLAVDSGPPPIVYPTAACATCTNDQCGVETAACSSTEACKTRALCVAKCAPDDVKCRGNCESDLVLAEAPQYLALDTCRRKSCTDACYGRAGFGAFLDPACACVDAPCAKEMLACVRNGLGANVDFGSCERRFACIARHPNPDDWVTCTSDVGTDVNPVLDCARQQECGSCTLGKGELVCGNNFSYLKTRQTTVPFTLGVVDVESKNVVGAKVNGCLPARCDICGPVGAASKTTDALGKATLDVPMNNGGYDGFFEVLPAGTQLPTLVYAGRRIHRQEDVLGTISLDAAILDFYAAPKSAIKGRGHVVVTLHDCIWARTADASFDPLDTADSSTVIGFFQGTDLVPGRTTTTTSGVVVFLNVKPGPTTLVARKDGKEISRLNICVRADAVTDGNMYPNSN